MVRRIALTIGLLVTVVACGDGGDVRPAAAPDAASEAKLTRLRETDVCALLPRADLAAVGPVTAVGTHALYGCRAVVGEGRAEGAVTWIVQAVDPPAPAWGEVATVDGATVVLVGDQDVLTPDEIARASIRQCTAYAPLPTGGSVTLTVAMPSTTEMCSAARASVTVALAGWRRFPRLGESPDTVRTVLTGADPCAVLAELPEARRGDFQWIDRCWFTLDGRSMYVEYEHSTDREFENYDRVPIANRPAFRTSDTSDAAYLVRVGPTFDPAADGYQNLEVPTATVRGGERATQERVVAAVMALFPAVW